MRPDNPYTKMQKSSYAHDSSFWSADNRDPVVGSFDAHNQHADYQLLFSDLNTKDMIALDFGCGPGRNIVRYNSLFKCIDGVDLDSKNLENARLWTAKHNITDFNLYECNGIDLSNIDDEQYDFVMSTICLQHICVHEIRFNYFKEFFRVLKFNSCLAFQMGFGSKSNAVNYYDNCYDAQSTNGGCDTIVENPEQIENDLLSVGFRDFRYWIRPTGPGDSHPNWIFIQAKKYDSIR